MTDIETMRVAFEATVKTQPKLSGNTPLGAKTVNGQFYAYMNPDTDNLWIGFAFGFRVREKQIAPLVNELRASANKASNEAASCGNPQSKEQLKGQAYGMREAALRLETLLG